MENADFDEAEDVVEADMYVEVVEEVVEADIDFDEVDEVVDADMYFDGVEDAGNVVEADDVEVGRCTTKSASTSPSWVSTPISRRLWMVSWYHLSTSSLLGTLSGETGTSNWAYFAIWYCLHVSVLCFINDEAKTSTFTLSQETNSVAMPVLSRLQVTESTAPPMDFNAPLLENEDVKHLDTVLCIIWLSTAAPFNPLNDVKVY